MHRATHPGQLNQDPAQDPTHPTDRVTEIDADYFDGRTGRARRVRVHVSEDHLWIRGDGVQRAVALHEVHWPERQRHGARIAHLADGASVHCDDGRRWDLLAREAGQTESPVVAAQQSWRNTMVAAVALMAVLIAGYQWGLPMAARCVLVFIPHEVDHAIGHVAFNSIAQRWLQPSSLSESERRQVREAFEQAVETAYPADHRPVYHLRFQGGRLGPNAFALPGGFIVVTDDLVRLAGDAEPLRTDMLIGVLAHEMGHVRYRHGMRMIVQATLIGAAASAALGDFSTMLAGAPALLATHAYSRGFEREADHESARVLLVTGRSPAVMATFFERIEQHRLRLAARQGASDGAGQVREHDTALAIALTSHPPDAERIAYFENAGDE